MFNSCTELYMYTGCHWFFLWPYTDTIPLLSVKAHLYVLPVVSFIYIHAGPLASLLCNRFSCRSVVIVGGILTTSGILITGFADNLWFTFFSNGLLSGWYSVACLVFVFIMAAKYIFEVQHQLFWRNYFDDFCSLIGLGQAFSYTSAVVIVGLYFHKRRSTAVGIANAGIGGGTFIFPPLVEFLFRELGFQGAFLIIAGLVLQGCVAGGLFRPISLQRKILLHQK